jgi:ribonuclease HII
MYNFFNDFCIMQLLDRYQHELIEAGCDEAGRGCLAGPVVCAAVILPDSFHHPDLNDSKQLSEKKRNLLRPIIEREAISFAVEFLSAEEIGALNILKASLTGMERAAKRLTPFPELILVDGNKPLLDPMLNSIAMIQGDGRFKSIAAASVLAKTYRDEYMEQLHEEFPEYAWNINKGYPTKAHRLAIEQFGPTPFHRPGFNLLGNSQLVLPLD